MALSPKQRQRFKGLMAEMAILTAAMMGMATLTLLRRGQQEHLELTIALWTFVGLAVVTVANVWIRHRLWVLTFAGSLGALVAPLACLERLHEPSAAGGPTAETLLAILFATLAAAACMIGSLISGRLSA